ncbi:protein ACCUMULATION AND REPLICATION OF CHLOROPLASTS 3, chloroplastic isoform X2 [Apium graveolens]|uniref:protein ACCUMULATION AND REPLICATION OF CHLOROPLASTS 3, chloroplastic isoform X2 n=1 Tax=Apium graveolens TaxID=4045 RepID=UPI003D79FFFD
MELPISSNLLRSISRASICPITSEYTYRTCTYSYKRSRHRLKCNSKPLRVELSLEQGFIKKSGENVWEDCKVVEVIAIGSRRDAVLDYCLDERNFWGSALRFWDVNVKDSVNVELQQRVLEKDSRPCILEAPSALQLHSKALILVSGAAYGSEFRMLLDILKTVKSADGLVFGIILKPFSFEGRRRRNEVKDLADKLQECANFCIMVDTDTLLEKDALTLDEALKTANNAILTAINAISILVSDMHIKFLDVPNVTMKELEVSELQKFLGAYQDAKIGFGTAYNIKTSIMRSLYECPFLAVDIKDIGTVALCLTSSGAVKSNDVLSVLHLFRQTAEFKGSIIVSIVHEPNMEPNLIATTVVTLGYAKNVDSVKGGIFSRLVQHFPSIFNLWAKRESKSINTEQCGFPEDENMTPANDATENFDSVEVNTLLGSNGDDKLYMARGSLSQSEIRISEVDYIPDSSVSSDTSTKASGSPIFQRELLLSRHNIGAGYAQDWATEEATGNPVSAPGLDIPGIFKLPIGVKPSEELKEDKSITYNHAENEDIINTEIKTQPQISPSVPWDALTDASYEAVTDLYSNASAILKGNNADVSKRQGNLSARAASMLESERESSKKWSPVVEIKYRGGSYMGRCQGGLPEGKGRLSHGDGSTYDGMWRYGKRSGLGTFCFSNGDVFRGSWRDDLMHGKGWLYFHTGDRWFVNFWKGKANGEGRFYSRKGEIFFGQFKDGWRHGQFLCIDVHGERCLEIWDEGVLVSRKQLDSDSD